MNATTTKTSRRLRRALCSLATVTGLVSAAILASNGAAYGKTPDRSPSSARTDTVEGGQWTDSSGQTMDASGNRPEGVPTTPAAAEPAADARTSAQGNWSLLSPPGGDIFDVAVSTVDPKVVLAGFAPQGGLNGGSLYRSDDNGATWSEVPGLRGISVNTIEFTAAGTAYVGTQDGVFHSSDGGLSWAADPLRIGNNDQVLDVTVAPANPSVIWAGVSGALGFQKINLLRSTDGGATWTNRTPADMGGVSARAVAIDPTDPNTVIAGFENGTVWVTTDGGTTWANRSAGLPRAIVNDLVYDGSRLLVGGGQAFNNQSFGLLQSNDLGLTWTALHDDAWPALMVSGIAVDPNDSDTLFVSTSGTGVHRSTDGGTTWQTSIGGTNGMTGRSVHVAPGNSGEIFFSTDSRAVFRSTDGGDTFVQSSNGIAEIDLHSVHVNPRDPKEIAIAFQAQNSGGVFSTVDGGATWNVEPLPPTRYSVVRFAPDGTLYAISSGPSTVAPEGLYRREADGSWTGLGPDQGPLFESDLKAVRFSPTDPDLILLGGSDFGVAGTEATAWRSDDRGRTWTKAYEGSQSQETVRDLEILADGTDQEVVASVASAAMERAALRSEDGGRSWSMSTIGLSGAQFGQPQLCTSAVDPHTVYLAAGPTLSTVSVFRSIDGGVTWRPTGWTNNGSGAELACDPADGRVVYLVVNADPRVVRSEDAGVTFSPFGEGIEGLRQPRSLTFAEDSRLLLASGRGSYVRDVERDAITAAGSARKEKGQPITDLSWDGATSTEVDVYRDGALVATVPNDGSYSETPAARGRGTVTYQVCRVDSSICSNKVTVQF